MGNKKKPGVGFGVMLLRDNKILLGLRHKDPEKADSELHGEGTWTMPGGKLDFQESFEQGGAREVMEETGITIKEEDLKLISLRNDIVHDAHFITIGMLCTKFEGNAQVMEPDEITKWKWWELNKLPKNIFFPSAEVIENYKEAKIYLG